MIRYTHSRLIITLTLTCTLLLGCGANDAAPKTAEEPQTFTEQAGLGAKLYGQQCASCHGDQGQGMNDAPRLVGLKDGALPLDPPASRKLRETRFVTAADVASFVVSNMPPGNPSHLTTDDYLAILAFDLSANGFQLDAPVTLDAAEKLVIPRE